MGLIRGGRVLTIPAGVRSVRAPRSAAAPAAWWVVAGKTCLRAYAPKGAANYDASLIDLTATMDAFPGTAPSWAAGTGWSFAAASSQWLKTGLYADTSPLTVLFRFANFSVGYNGAYQYRMAPNAGGNQTWIYGGTSKFATLAVAGTMGLAGGNQPYKDGLASGTAFEDSAIYHSTLCIGCWWDGFDPANFCTGDIIAWAAWGAELTADEMAAKHTAMMAL